MRIPEGLTVAALEAFPGVAYRIGDEVAGVVRAASVIGPDELEVDVTLSERGIELTRELIARGATEGLDL